MPIDFIVHTLVMFVFAADSVVKKTYINKVTDKTLVIVYIAGKAIKQVNQYMTELIKSKKKNRRDCRITRKWQKWQMDLWLHYQVKKAKELGLKMSSDTSKKVYGLYIMDMYRKTGTGRIFVGYVLINYNAGKSDKEV